MSEVNVWSGDDSDWVSLNDYRKLERQLAEVRQAWQDCREEFAELRQELDEARDEIDLKSTALTGTSKRMGAEIETLRSQLAEARARLERRKGPFTAGDPMYPDPIQLIENLEDKLHECQDSRSSDIAMMNQLELELAEARAALAEIDQHLTDLVLGERGWWGFWRDVHAAALKAAREAMGA